MYVFAERFRSSSRTFVEDEQEIQPKQPSDLILNKFYQKKESTILFESICKNSRMYSIGAGLQVSIVNEQIKNRWLSSIFFSFISILWICVKCNFCIEKNYYARFIYKLCILILRASIFDTWLMDESLQTDFRRHLCEEENSSDKCTKKHITFI